MNKRKENPSVILNSMDFERDFVIVVRKNFQTTNNFIKEKEGIRLVTQQLINRGWEVKELKDCQYKYLQISKTVNGDKTRKHYAIKTRTLNNASFTKPIFSIFNNYEAKKFSVQNDAEPDKYYLQVEFQNKEVDKWGKIPWSEIPQ